MSYEFVVTEQPAQPVLSKRTRTSVEKLPQVLGAAYQEIFQYINGLDEQLAEQASFCAYYNMDMEDLDVEMGFPVTRPLPGIGEIRSSEIPAGKQVSCMYKGPYREMEPAYNEMLKWMAGNGYKPTGVSYEFYYNSPQQVPESELLTKIVFPVY